MNRSPDRRPAGRTGAPPAVWRATLATVALAAPALAVHWLGADALVAFDRAAIAAGEGWRIVTGHWAHWSFDHLAWDLAAFAVLTWLAWRRGAARTLTALGLAVIAIPLAIRFWSPELATYRGLSGLDSALFVLVAVDLLRREAASGRRDRAATVALALVAFAAKVGVEWWSGATLFADSAAFVPVPLAHLVGGACGLLVGLSRHRPPAIVGTRESVAPHRLRCRSVSG